MLASRQAAATTGAAATKPPNDSEKIGRGGGRGREGGTLSRFTGFYATIVPF